MIVDGSLAMMQRRIKASNAEKEAQRGPSHFGVAS
jgi:hypothetical protein